MNNSHKPKEVKPPSFTTNSGTLHGNAPTGTGNKSGSTTGAGAKYQTRSGIEQGNKPTGTGNKGGSVKGVGSKFQTPGSGIKQVAKPRTPR